MDGSLNLLEAQRLIRHAQQAAESAYAPYSDFPVGAALLTAEGRIVTGCNVENASYGLTMCAERVAIGKAVSEGQCRFVALAVWAARTPHGFITPCGACRQVMSEFLDADTPVIFADREGGLPRQVMMSALLPSGFALNPRDDNAPYEPPPAA